MTPAEFITKWQASTRNERAACHEHFIDLCRLLDEPTARRTAAGRSAARFADGAIRTRIGDCLSHHWKRVEITDVFYGRRDQAAFYRRQHPDNGFTVL
ncbi:MAG TPA: hypothetical protein VLI93_13045 [Acetobacteraceae bacterium]|nr:hypothetical protein [Acetobacteraceae bacterium]